MSITRDGVLAALSALLLAACHEDGAKPPGGATTEEGLLLRGGVDVRGAAVEFGVVNGRIVAPSEISVPSQIVELGGRTVVPAFIDSHVHLAYYDVAAELPLGGVVGAVDFAAPLRSFDVSYPIPVVRSGPMLTPLGGYPLQSWGSDGYGLELATESDAGPAVDTLLAAGATFIKAPLLGSIGLTDEMLAAVVTRAHERGARVAVHATSAVDAQRAIASDIDILAHTPTAALSEETLTGFGERCLVSTLSAFGGSASTENLRALRERGALILYGTDLGNTRFAGIQASEIQALVDAGLTGADIVQAGTSDAAEFWGFDELGTLEPGKRASFLVLDESPQVNPLSLTSPRAVVWEGTVVTGSWP
jgi:imidazolonepropionase-like amidohydrolase